MCRLSSSRQHVLLFFNYLTDNKDCLPICRVKTDLQKTKEKLKVTAKWVAKIIEKQGSIAKRETKRRKVNTAVQIWCLVIISLLQFPFSWRHNPPSYQISRGKVKKILEKGRHKTKKWRCTPAQDFNKKIKTNNCFNLADQQNKQFNWSLILLQSYTWCT